LEQQEIKNYAEEKHKSILTEKNTELEDLKQKYSELKKQYNESMEDLPNYIQGQAMRLTIKAISKKD